MVRKHLYETVECVIDEVRSQPNNPELCDLVYVRNSGIGIRTPDGERAHISWDVAESRFTPATVAT